MQQARDDTDFDMRRTKSPHAQTAELMAVWPPPLKSIEGDMPGSTSGIDAAVLVIRHVVARLRDPFRNPNVTDGDSAVTTRLKGLVEVAERNNALLKYAWLDFANLRADEPTLQRKMVELSQRAKAFGQPQTAEEMVLNGPRNTTFEEIMEHEMMFIGLWARMPMLLYRSGHWIELLDPDSDSGWRAESWADLQLAAWSLIRYNGTQSLGAAVDNEFGVFRYDLSDGSKARREARRPAFPAVIRVYYDPSELVSCGLDAPGWSELRSFKSRPLLCLHPELDVDENWEIRWYPCVEFRYNLIAAVRLRDENSEDDHVRLYDLTGENLACPQQPGEEKAPYVNDDWRIGGKTGGRYYLVYASLTLLKGLGLHGPARIGFQGIQDAQQGDDFSPMLSSITTYPSPFGDPAALLVNAGPYSVNSPTRKRFAEREGGEDWPAPARRQRISMRRQPVNADQHGEPVTLLPNQGLAAYDPAASYPPHGHSSRTTIDLSEVVPMAIPYLGQNQSFNFDGHSSRTTIDLSEVVPMAIPYLGQHQSFNFDGQTLRTTIDLNQVTHGDTPSWSTSTR
ncbi:hypothetical protein QBC42DRAFT_253504 [Cladorrhinum samala]|uniref:Uncharacterized protein n=1 Tax=Cladorrhinum samala TaxID=585594 RepID=A0AAV9HKI0_9PEZI|nr:hypothetical protein QBC42DRAFT_253504 [Cladorrhinum samala]